MELVRSFGAGDAHVLEAACRRRKDLLSAEAGEPVNRFQRWWLALWQPWRLVKVQGAELGKLRREVRLLKRVTKLEQERAR